jgi:virulence factor MgtC-like protein
MNGYRSPEQQLRAQIVAHCGGHDLILHGVRTEPIGDAVALTAYLLVDRDAPTKLERLVAQLSQQRGVHTVQWQAGTDRKPELEANLSPEYAAGMARKSEAYAHSRGTTCLTAMPTAGLVPGAATSITVHRLAGAVPAPPNVTSNRLACNVSPAELATDGNADTNGASATAIAARPETDRARVIFIISAASPTSQRRNHFYSLPGARKRHLTEPATSCWHRPDR